jgi:hypothetical protein
LCQHLVGELGGQAGLGCQLRREAGRIGQPGVLGGDRRVDYPGERRGEQLVESGPDGGLVRGPRVSSASSWVRRLASQRCSGGELGGGSGEGG